ncbi:MAG: hypothetical protein EBW06_01760 [Gammaproteobacteria bacterium]|nr:hypothetical protein [Gammaproteobacteria bacterium]
MIKQLVLLKKRDDLTVEAFRTYYETHHRLIGEKYLNAHVARYVRRYLETPPGMAAEAIIENGAEQMHGVDLRPFLAHCCCRFGGLSQAFLACLFQLLAIRREALFLVVRLLDPRDTPPW